MKNSYNLGIKISKLSLLIICLLQIVFFKETSFSAHDPQQIPQNGLETARLVEFETDSDIFQLNRSYEILIEDLFSKQITGKKFTKVELRFIYNLDRRFDEFFYINNQKLSKILSERDLRSDIAFIYSHWYSANGITVGKNEFKPGISKVHIGDLSLSDLDLDNPVILPDVLIGNLNLDGMVSVSHFKLPKIIIGDLSIQNLKSAKAFKLPYKILGDLFLEGLSSAKEIKLPHGVVNYFGPSDIPR